MFKKLVATFITAVIICTTFLTAIPVSAATGTDISETFEYYASMDGVDPSELLRAFWKTGGCLENNKISIDDTKSAPDRGDGKSAGNYRSMKMDVKFSKSADGTWGSCRINTHEDWGCIKDSITKMDKSLAFSFWADVEKEMKVKASIDINNVPYFKVITLTPGWKQYTLKFTELEPATDKYGEGTGIFEVENMSQAGTGGWKYAFFCGFKFEIFSDWQEAQENTFWVDTFAIHGDTIKERTEYKVEVGTTVYPTELDCDGSVPKNFVPDSSTSSSDKNNNTSSSDKNSGTTSTNNNTTNSTNNNTTNSTNKNTTTNSNGSSSSENDNGDSSIIDTDASADSSESSNGNIDDNGQNSKINLGMILTVIFGASFVIGNAAAFILFVVQKGKSKK